MLTTLSLRKTTHLYIFVFTSLIFLPVGIAQDQVSRNAAEAPFDFSTEFDTADIQSNSTVVIAGGTVIKERSLAAGFAWSASEEKSAGLWVVGSTASVRFFTSGIHDKKVHMRCLPFRYPNAPQQNLQVLVNGKQLQQFDMPAAWKEYQIPIPSAFVKEGFNDLSFHFSQTRSPSDLNPESSDNRQLSCFFSDLSVLPDDAEPSAIEPPATLQPHQKTNLIRQSLGTKVSYHLRVPQNSQLSLRYARPKSGPNSAIASFACQLERDGKNEIVLFQDHLPPMVSSGAPDWQLKELQIDEYADQIVALSFIYSATSTSKGTDDVLLWTGSVSGSTKSTSESKRSFDPPTGIILISLDTLRADSLGCHGYNKPTSPLLDEFASESSLFENCLSHAPSTLTSHGVMFTSLYPEVHGGSFSTKSSIRRDVPTLAEQMRAGGYRTVAIHGGGQLDSVFGTDRGFEVYNTVEEYFAETVKHGITWLDAHENEKFFMFLHTYQIHAPYTPDSEFAAIFTKDLSYQGPLGHFVDRPEIAEMEANGTLTPLDILYTKGLYDAEINYTDTVFETLTSYLKAKGRYEDTLIMVVSDHGEEFNDHGSTALHSHTLYQELLHIPMIVKWPKGLYAGTRISQLVSLADVSPTLLDAAGLPPFSKAVGASVLPLASQSGVYPRTWSYSHMEKLSREALNTEEWKLIFNRTPQTARTDRYVPAVELYNLRQDPQEQANLSSSYPILLGYLLSIMERTRADLYEDITSKSSQDTRVVLPNELRERLKSLGYVD